MILQITKTAPLFLLLCSILNGNEISEIIDREKNLAKTWRENIWGFSEKSIKELRGFSDREILQGFFDKIMSYDSNSRNKKSAWYGKEEKSFLKFNHQIIEDITPLREMLAKANNSREFYHLSGLAIGFSQSRKVDFIPEYFNWLYRDGGVSYYEGERTPTFSADVSKWAYMVVRENIEILGGGYEPAPVDENQVPIHEKQVDHLARWLIANWPGCENYTLSDKNVPSILSEGASKRVQGGGVESGEVSEGSDTDDFEWTWPIIAACLFLVGALGYWGFKKAAFEES